MIEDTEKTVVRDILNRQEMGTKKYGTTVAGNPLELREWLQHQYEELLDAAIYCKRAIQEIDFKTEEAKRIERDMQIQIQRHQEEFRQTIRDVQADILKQPKPLDKDGYEEWLRKRNLIADTLPFPPGLEGK